MIVRDPRTGEPTGILKDMAMAPVEGAVPAPSDAQRDAALRRALAYAASKGVTAFAHVSVVPADLGTYLRARAAGALTARAALYFPLETWHAVADTIARIGRGDDWVWIGGVKGYMDGSLGSRTALFYEPYDDDPKTAGLLRTPEDSLRAWIGAADSAGLQVTVHAIGERANGLILDIYDSVARAHGSRDRRFRIEHAQHLRPGDVDRIARSGVIASMQPYHAIDDGRWAEKRIGPDRVKGMYVFRSLLDRRAHLAFGSDWSVAPIDPILGIYAAVTRRTLDGKHPGGWLPEQKISVEEALRAYTSGAAYGVFAERRRGRLAPGFKADLVLLDQDLTRIPPEAIERVAVRATVVGRPCRIPGEVGRGCDSRQARRRAPCRKGRNGLPRVSRVPAVASRPSRFCGLTPFRPARDLRLSPASARSSAAPSEATCHSDLPCCPFPSPWRATSLPAQTQLATLTRRR